MAAYSRKQYSGAASPTTTTSTLTNVGTSVTLLATTGWPSIAGIPFYVAIEAGTANEEKCLATISGSTLTLTRAQDDTTAVAHAIGSSIYPVFSANDADEANELVSKLTTKGDLLVTDGSGLFRLGVGANGYFLKANSSASVGVEWASIPTINNLDDVGDVTISTVEDGDFLVYDNTASAWVNETLHFITVSDTAPNDEVSEGDLWYNSLELELYTYYSGVWIQLTATPETSTVEELDNVYADNLTVGDVLAYDGYDWYNDTVSNLFGSHIIALSGDVSGSVMFDGSASVNISTTIQSNGVALGADTTGSYVQSLVAGTGVTLSNNSGESATPTIAIGQAVGTTASVSFAHVATDSLNITNNVVGGGNITLSPNVSSYVIGDTGPAGGKIFITPSTSGNTTGKYFEVAPIAGEVIRTWATDTDPGVGLGNAATTVVGADGTDIGTGQQNTADIVAQAGNVAATSAAVYCDQYSYGGFSDWFLPSKDELNELYVQRNVVGGLTVSYYSTSSEYSNDAFWFQSFIDGNPNTPYKNNAYYIRPVRSFVAPAPAGIVTGNLTGNVTGNASTATTLQTARTISLSGDVSGSVSFNGSANATISTAIQPNSVALGTDTTGNYMSALTQGTGVTITHTPSEGSNATIAIGQAVGTSASVTFANLTVTGDLTVSGTTTSINTETLTVDDNIIVLNNNATGAPSQNAGIEVERGSSTNVALRWNESSDKWETTNDGSTYSVVATNGNIALGTDTTGNSDNVTEGTTNLYFTDGRARTALLADNAGTASGIRFIAPNTGTVELISQEATRFVRVTSNAAAGGGKTEIQGSAEILASSSISDPGHLTVAGSVTVGGGVVFEGDTANDYETSLVVVDPTADRTITLPNADGTVALNGSIALGTDTTGNYMSDLTQGTGVTITHTPSEGSNATIAIGQSVATSASVTFADVTATGNVSISGRIDKTTVRESVADVSVSASVVTADYSTGDIFYVGTAPASNFTVNLTNAPTDNGKAITVVLFVTQGATGFYPNVVQVAGSAQTIKWANGAAPTPTSSTGKIDIFSFTFVRRSSAWTVFGSSNLGY